MITIIAPVPCDNLVHRVEVAIHRALRHLCLRIPGYDPRCNSHALRRCEVLPQPPRRLPQLSHLGRQLSGARQHFLRLGQAPPRRAQLLLQRDHFVLKLDLRRRRALLHRTTLGAVAACVLRLGEDLRLQARTVPHSGRRRSVGGGRTALRVAAGVGGVSGERLRRGSPRPLTLKALL
jgi:hypothetical protein